MSNDRSHTLRLRTLHPREFQTGCVIDAYPIIANAMYGMMLKNTTNIL